MPELKPYNLFISHAWTYGEDYKNLKKLLDSAPFFKYNNYSAPKDNPLINLDGTKATNKTQIKEAIKRKINPVSCVLIISGLYYNNREWMQFELEYANKINKPIIAIKPWGNTRMPSEVEDVADIVVNWNTDSIVSAIRNYSL